MKEVDHYLPTVLTCTSKFNKKGWSTGEAQFGELKGGLEIEIPLNFGRYLLSNEEFFEYIQKRIDLEVCVGVNGVMWVKTSKQANLVILSAFFRKAGQMSLAKARELLYSFSEKFQS